MTLSADQFREHLDELEARTGLSVGRNFLELPAGMRLPAVAHHFDISEVQHDDWRDLNLHRTLRSWIPEETGNLHRVWGLTREKPSNFAVVRFGTEVLDVGYIPKGSHELTGNWPKGPPDDPEAFQRQVVEATRGAVPASERQRERNVNFMSRNPAGTIKVAHTTRRAGKRQYHFDIGSGQLKEV